MLIISKDVLFYRELNKKLKNDEKKKATVESIIERLTNTDAKLTKEEKPKKLKP